MKKINNVISMHDFDFARLLNSANSDDITEWFSDHDIYLSDIIQEHHHRIR